MHHNNLKFLVSHGTLHDKNLMLARYVGSLHALRDPSPFHGLLLRKIRNFGFPLSEFVYLCVMFRLFRHCFKTGYTVLEQYLLFTGPPSLRFYAAWLTSCNFYCLKLDLNGSGF